MSPRGRRGGAREGRSEEDRRAARLEREQRRARREGRPVPRSFEDLPVAGPGLDASGLGIAAPPEGGRPDPTPRAQPAASRGGLWAAAPADRAPDPTTAAPAPSPAAPAPASPAAPDAGPAPAVRDPGPIPAVPDAPRAAPAPAPAASAAPSREARPSAAPAADPRPWWSRTEAPAAESPAPPAPARTAPGATPGDPAPARTGASPASTRPAAPTRLPAPARPVVPTAPGTGPAPSRAPGTPTVPATGPAPSPGAGDPFDSDDPGETGEHAAAETPDTPGEHASPALVPLRTAGRFHRPGPATPQDGGGRKRGRRAKRAAAAAAGPATVHTRTAPARRGVSRIAAVLVLLPIVLVAVAAFFLFQPFGGEGEGDVRVKIPPGSSVDEIGTLLKDRGVISSPLAFSVRARLSGDGTNLKAGTLRLKRDMSYSAALTALQQDPLPPSTVRVSIPEGLSRREIASSIKKAGITGSYLTASAKSSGFDPKDYGQPRSRKGLEGFLFPATYELQRGGATASALVREQLKSFAANFDTVSMRRARRAQLTQYDVLIIASMIEREVRIASERRLVSAVIWNRLKDGIPLGIDATTRYAVKNWSRPLLQSELDRETPYDTRRRKGLPPTPIGSPGLASIKAAADPADVSYLYYVVRPCGGGRHAFATSNAEFEKDRLAYNAAQRRAGGDPSPVDAKGC